MNPKNVWVINQYVGSPKYGMHYRWYYLAKHLIAQGHDVKIVSGGFSHHLLRYPETPNYYNYEQIDGIDYCWVKLNRYSNNKGAKRLISQVLFAFKTFFKKPFSNRPDVVIASSPSLFTILVAWFYSKRFTSKLLFEVRDLWPLTLTALGGHSSRHPVVWVFSCLERFGYKKSDAVISLLPNAIEYMRTVGLADEKFHYIPNAAEPISPSEKAGALPEKINSILESGKFIITYAGSMGISNAMDYFIDAAISLLQTRNDFHFLIIGEGSEKERLLAKSNGCENISFHRYVPRTSLSTIFSKSDLLYCGLHTSELYTKYGVSLNKLFEYMLSKKPIVFSSSALNDSVGDANAGITVPSEDSKAIEKAILEIVKLTKEERRQLGQNGYDYVLNHHSFSSLAAQYSELF